VRKCNKRWVKQNPDKHRAYQKKKELKHLIKKMDELGFTLETQKALVLDGPCLVKRERELMRGVVKC